MSTRKQRARRAQPNLRAKPVQQMRRAYQPVNILSEEQEQRVHELSLKLLQEIGLKIMLPQAWPILEANGCRVDRDSGMTCFPPEVVEEFLGKAPCEFVMKARNPANDLSIGGDIIHYGSASSAPNVLDEINGRRPGTQADFRKLVKLNHMLSSVAFHSGHPVEPIDTPVNTRHLLSAYDWHTLSDKVTRIYAIGKTRVIDSLNMVKIAHGIDDAELAKSPRLHGSINVNSPLVMDAPLLEAAMEIAKAGQANVVSPVAFAGAMSPITLSGSIVQCNAEAIAVIAFLQMVAAGAPCFYGVLTTPVDMKSGAPAMGVPETVTGTLANGQMARRYQLPQRVMLGSTANTPDAQSAYETMFSLWAAQLSGAHFVYHAHGWMEGGLTTGFEKTVLDAEMIQMMGALQPEIDFSDAEEVFEAIAGVGPGGHFLGTEHTLKRYESAFHAPMLSDWRPYEFWQADGSHDTAWRATKKWQELLEAYQPPKMDPGIEQALSEYVRTRTAELGDSDI